MSYYLKNHIIATFCSIEYQPLSGYLQIKDKPKGESNDNTISKTQCALSFD